MSYSKVLLITLCTATGLLATSCGTMNGIGRDINAAGRGIQRAAR